MLAGDDQRRRPPQIDQDRLHAYRLGRIRSGLAAIDADAVLLVSPISLRYALDYRSYLLYQSHIPTAYALVGSEGPTVLCNGVGVAGRADAVRHGRALAYFDAAEALPAHADALAGDVAAFLQQIGRPGGTVAVEYVNPSITQALEARGLGVVDGVAVSERARVIKSAEEIACIRWAVEVAERAIQAVADSLRPGVSELELWALLTYTNAAHDGDWHEGRVLCSGPRTNPWLQGASSRRVEVGDLLGLDTDMVGPFGYFADVSRTMLCGTRPTRRQEELYALAMAEIEHNITLLRPGVSLVELQQQAFEVPEEFHEQAYVCIVHGVGMSDEYPRINPRFRGPTPYDGVLEAGMVLCVESYMGAVGEREGVKLEQQVLLTQDGPEVLSSPLEGLLHYQR